YLKCHKPCGYLVALRIQPHFHPMPKGDGLSRSGRTVIHFSEATIAYANIFSLISPFLFSTIQKQSNNI
ncbi:hypothetical protein, partial [Bacillus albus]|uniref:hypothetical protein n=1 Tax=Bacillus albus TaxID=2026189 RepID=UPI003D3034B1